MLQRINSPDTYSDARLQVTITDVNDKIPSFQGTWYSLKQPTIKKIIAEFNLMYGELIYECMFIATSLFVFF